MIDDYIHAFSVQCASLIEMILLYILTSISNVVYCYCFLKYCRLRWLINFRREKNHLFQWWEKKQLLFFCDMSWPSFGVGLIIVSVLSGPVCHYILNKEMCIIVTMTKTFQILCYFIGYISDDNGRVWTKWT